MIPTFPEFKPIEITDKEEVENFTKNYPPYSDFNFISLFCWDVDGKRRLSWLNGNWVCLILSKIWGTAYPSFF